MMSNVEKFGKYILLEKIAAGGMAEVYLAKSYGASGVNKFVAIKRILPQFSNNPEFIEMFQEEAKVSVNLNHSNVVSIYDFGTEKGQFYIVMEFVEGRNLRQIINELKKSNRSFKIEEAVYIVKEAASGLDHAHRCVDKHTGRPLNITHRDMSPQNIMVSFEGEAKVIDFGIAKKSENNGEETKAGTLKGKFAYMSPEQAEAEEVDPRTDVFALGIILWELLANDRLFTGSNENAVLRKVRECQIPSIRKINPLVPQELERIVMKALAKDKNVRYQTAANMQKDLNRFLNMQYPDFSTHDFSKTVIECFKNSYLEGREKLISYSKIEFNFDAETKNQNQIPPPPHHQLTPPPLPKLTEVEPVGLSVDQKLKIDLDGIKNAKTQPVFQNQKTQVNLSQPKTTYENHASASTRLNKTNTNSKNASGGHIADIFIKLIIICFISAAGYFSYNQFIQPQRNLAKSKSAPNAPVKNEGQLDLSATASVKVSLSSQPSGARIFVDDIDTGRITPAIISVTAHKDLKMTLKKDGYYKYEVTRSFMDTTVLSSTLQKMPDAGYININVQNGGAKPVVYVNSQRLSELPPIKRYAVTAGAQVTVSAVNPITQLKDEVTVKVDSNREVNVDLILGRTK